MSEDRTPAVQYEEETGYLVLKGPTCRQVLCRLDGFTLYFWDRLEKRERPVTLDDLVCHMREADRDKDQS